MDKYFLSTAETMIMKAIWDSQGRRINTCDLILILKENYGKEYARSTVMTFLQKLSYKGFIRCKREGKNSYIEILKEEEGYVAELINNQIDFWYEGNVANAISALIERDKISKRDLKQIVSMFDSAE